MRAINLFPNSPLNQVRLNIGDHAGEYITDDVLNYMLSENSDSVSIVSILAAEYILKNLAKLRDESVGPVMVKWSQVYKNYKELYAKLLEELSPDTDSSTNTGLYFFGGTSNWQTEAFYSNSDNTPPPIRAGFGSKYDDILPSRASPYVLE